MFDQLVVSTRMSGTHKRWTVIASAVGESLLLGVLVLVPLIYTEALPPWVWRTTLLTPGPPAPPEAPKPTRLGLRTHVVSLRELRAPTKVPSGIARDAGAPVVDYVDTVPGGSDASALDTLLRSGTPLPAPPPVQPETKRVRVTSIVQAAMLLNRVLPVYPMTAKIARISGTVELHAVIAKDGTVRELTYVSGPALLMKAAMDAVSQWRYRPTMLDEEAVEVETTIDVIFNLGG
jgi:protein TonB